MTEHDKLLKLVTLIEALNKDTRVQDDDYGHPRTDYYWVPQGSFNDLVAIAKDECS